MLDYNSSRDILIFKEYGRNVQKMVNHAIHIEDEDRRNAVVRGIINLMGHMNPHLRNVEQFRHKLWDHIFMISKFKLEADSPYEPADPEPLDIRKAKLPYPKENLKFRHYGKNVELMIKKAVNMEDKEQQIEYARVIGNYMKMVYRSWNNDTVDDDVIINDLAFLSGGKIQLDGTGNLDLLSKSNQRKRPNNSNSNGRSNHRKHNNGRNNNNKFKRRKRNG